MQTAQRKVAIIGGGIAGCSTAHALAEQDMHVTLFERHEAVAQQASGNPLGMLYPRLSGHNAVSIFALAAYLYSLKFYQSQSLDHAVFQQCGLLQLGFNARERKRIEKVANSINPTIAHWLSTEETSAMAGTICQHPALYFPQAAWIRPQLVCNKMLQHSNIICKTRNQIQAINVEGDTLTIDSMQNKAEPFDIVVICNANEARQFSQTQHLKHQVSRGQLTQLSSTTNSKGIKTIICSDGYLSPAIDGQHTLGATFALNENDLAMCDADHQINLNKLKTIAPPLYQSLKSQVVGGRTALRCISHDHLPMVGELLATAALKTQAPRPNARSETLPWIKGLYVNIAHGSHGLINAPYSAQLLAQLIADIPFSQDQALHLQHLNPNRFILREMGLKKLAKTIATHKPCIHETNSSKP